MGELAVESTPIPGLLVIRLEVRTDDRGWFAETWQPAKMTALGLPDFTPAQANLAHNDARGTTRGLHAEPWDKLVSVASGRAFAAWVDLRAGDGFATTYTRELEPGMAVFVPRGVANGYQTLVPDTAYSYLVNDHWHADAAYVAVDLSDPALGIDWPIPPPERVVSQKDLSAPGLAEATAFPRRRPLVLGCGGQLGRALRAEFPDAGAADADELDLTDPEQVAGWPWPEHDVVLNAAAYTAVDLAETPDGRPAAWSLNAAAPASLARQAARHGLTLVHYSSDYVFDGTRDEHDEDEPLSPLGVYGQSKAAGEVAVRSLARHYLVRTSWVVGEGPNFVRTMARLADQGAEPSVVADQIGRLTFTDELARATRHLLMSGAPYGTYQVTNGGPPMSWADVAREVFAVRGRDPRDVTAVTTQEYVAARSAAGSTLAARPARSVLSLGRIEATGFTPADGMTALRAYASSLP